jgi:hypothetical protein
METALIRQFVTERDRALLSLDYPTLCAHFIKWNIRMPDDIHVFWIGVHKARTGCMSLPESARSHPRRWLHQRGYRAHDERRDAA